VWGIVEGPSVYIITEIFRNFCKNYGFEKRNLLRLLKENGMLIPNEYDGNPRTKKSYKGHKFYVYHILLPQNDESEALKEHTLLTMNSQKTWI